MFPNPPLRKQALLPMTLILLLAAGGCAHDPSRPAAVPAADAIPSDGGPAGNEPPATPSPSSSAAAFTYPESVANGWTGECPNSPPASAPRPTPPTVQQSPIDFTSPAIVPVEVAAAVNVFRPGSFDAHDNNIVFSSPLQLTWNGDHTYTPLGFHFHSPVEHVLPAPAGAGIAPPQLEIHIKATDASGKVVVFAVQYQANRAVTVDSRTLNALHDSIVDHTQGYQGVSLFETLELFRRGPFYTYVGSLTTPPCTTGVRFHVAKTPHQIPPAQMTKVLGVLHRTGMPDPNNRFPRQLTRPAPVVTLITPQSD